MKEIIFADDNFEFCIVHRTGINDTPLEILEVYSIGLADKHVVAIRLYQSDGYPYKGEPIKHTYDPDRTEIAHGMRMIRDTFAETQEYIGVLQDALTFAKRVNTWITENDWT